MDRNEYKKLLRDEFFNTLKTVRQWRKRELREKSPLQKAGCRREIRAAKECYGFVKYMTQEMSEGRLTDDVVQRQVEAFEKQGPTVKAKVEFLNKLMRVRKTLEQDYGGAKSEQDVEREKAIRLDNCKCKLVQYIAQTNTDKDGGLNLKDRVMFARLIAVDKGADMTTNAELDAIDTVHRYRLGYPDVTLKSVRISIERVGSQENSLVVSHLMQGMNKNQKGWEWAKMDSDETQAITTEDRSPVCVERMEAVADALLKEFHVRLKDAPLKQGLARAGVHLLKTKDFDESEWKAWKAVEMTASGYIDHDPKKLSVLVNAAKDGEVKNALLTGLVKQYFRDNPELFGKVEVRAEDFDKNEQMKDEDMRSLTAKVGDCGMTREEVVETLRNLVWECAENPPRPGWRIGISEPRVIETIEAAAKRPQGEWRDYLQTKTATPLEERFYRDALSKAHLNAKTWTQDKMLDLVSACAENRPGWTECIAGLGLQMEAEKIAGEPRETWRKSIAELTENPVKLTHFKNSLAQKDENVKTYVAYKLKFHMRQCKGNRPGWTKDMEGLGLEEPIRQMAAKPESEWPKALEAVKGNPSKVAFFNAAFSQHDAIRKAREMEEGKGR